MRFSISKRSAAGRAGTGGKPWVIGMVLAAAFLGIVFSSVVAGLPVPDGREVARSAGLERRFESLSSSPPHLNDTEAKPRSAQSPDSKSQNRADFAAVEKDGPPQPQPYSPSPSQQEASPNDPVTLFEQANTGHASAAAAPREPAGKRPQDESLRNPSPDPSGAQDPAKPFVAEDFRIFLSAQF